MTKHVMKLFDDGFDMIKSGQKKREYRLYDDKRKKLRWVIR